MNRFALWRRAFRDVATEALWSPALVFIVHVVSSRVFDAYERFPPLDIPMHLIGGFAIAFFFARATRILERLGLIQLADPLVQVVLVFGLICAAALFWEFAEYIADHTIGTHSQLTLDDTLFDMLLGLVGGSLFLILWALRLFRRDRVQPGLQADPDVHRDR